MDFKNSKIIICGLQDSGKTYFAKHLAKTGFKNPVWILVNHDDITNMPKNINVIVMEKKTTQELNDVIGDLIELAKNKKCDAIFIDEFDMFISNNIDIQKFPHINNLFINHRHFNQDKKHPNGNLAVVGITRRPQDTGAKFVESCKFTIIFALPKSDNVTRKFKAIDRELPEMIESLKLTEYKFVIKEVGEKPVLMNPISSGEATKLKGEEPNGKH